MLRYVFSLFIVILASIQAFAQTGPVLREINSINGFDEAMATIEESFRGALDRFPGKKPEVLVEAWRVAEAGAFDSARIIATSEAVLADTLRPEDLAVLLACFRSDFGMRISQIEIAATDPDVRQAKESDGPALYAALERGDPKRLELYNRLIDHLQVVDIGEAIALNMTYAMVSGMLGASRQPATDEQIAAVVKQVSGNVRAKIEDASRASTAWTYRDVGLEDLERYVDFVETPEATRYCGGMIAAIDKILAAEARSFGNRLMIALGHRKA
jgi:hypothetical protein